MVYKIVIFIDTDKAVVLTRVLEEEKKGSGDQKCSRVHTYERASLCAWAGHALEALETKDAKVVPESFQKGPEVALSRLHSSGVVEVL